ncbi:MAG: sulfite exporter TauE/SafE family protein [Rhodovarius sp.]|nr:sulfite exporter TauE/SafE family protein [Rhodovarius sp.]MDW8314705.1 sulfite exporter TauE/SafE family protein [Rhodovarius sp.]
MRPLECGHPRARTIPLPLPTDPLFYALAVPAVLISAIAKGGFAGASGNVLVPLMALAIPAPQAAAIGLLLLCAMDLSGLRAWWGQWDRREMRVLIPGGLCGVVLGALLFGLLSPRAIMGLIGVITLCFLAFRAWAGRRGLPPPSPHSVPRGFLAATAAGVTSTLAHAGGPPLQMYLLPRRLPRAAFAATNLAFFGLLNYVKLVPYAALGMFDASVLLTAALLLPLCPAGVYLGVWLQRRLSDQLFYRIVQAALLLTGVKLVWDGFFA